MLLYDRIEIRDFRLFSDQILRIGRLMTVISGRNRTGKSTILGMLANAGELKKYSATKLTGGKFRADFSEIFKVSRKYDLRGSNRFSIYLRDTATDNAQADWRTFRTTWQKNRDGSERFRLIPMKKLAKGKTETKFSLPVIYLGLSRLFPVGESSGDPIAPTQVKFPLPEDRDWFVSNYKKIFGAYDLKVEAVTKFRLNDANKKSGTGVTTDTYDYLANSAGEDDLGQILLAVLSMKTLRRAMGDEWQGGLLLIDEMEAALHASAQENLFKLLMKEAKEVGFQVAMTSHSTIVLDLAARSARANSIEHPNDVELYYFKNTGGDLKLLRNPSLRDMEADLYMVPGPRRKLVMAYTEDKEAYWMLKHLVDEIADTRLKPSRATVGCEVLVDMYNGDPEYFGDKLVIFDGDVKESTLDRLESGVTKRMKNILVLPGGLMPEKVIYTYLKNQGPESAFWQQAEKKGLDRDIVLARGPESDVYARGKERERYKKWFEDYKEKLDDVDLMKYWKEDNPDTTKEFLDAFRQAYNVTANRIGLPELQEEL